MLENFTVGMQIVPATFAGTCFILLFCYFRFTHDSSKSSINYFSNFLLALSFFTLLKPFQLLAGDTLVAKLICNARYIALFSIGGPAFVMALETLDSRISAINRKAIFAVGIVFALIYNLVMIPVAMMGLMTPVFAAIVMPISSLIVIANTALLKQRTRLEK